MKVGRFTCVVTDLACTAAVVLGQVVSLAILVTTSLWYAWYAWGGVDVLSAVEMLTVLPFLGVTVVGEALKCEHRCGQGGRLVHAQFLGFTLLAMFASLRWFEQPMHDIALIFGSHGRWGCQLYDDQGPAYLLRDSTMPFILFGPILGTTAAHCLVRGRKQ